MKSTTKCCCCLTISQTVLTLLVLINMFNYIDRQVLSAVVLEIQQEFHSSDSITGTLATIFLVVYMCTSPICGYLARRVGSWRLIGIGILIWTSASGGTGITTNIGQMLFCRALVGVGEGAYAPCAPAILSEFYPPHKLSSVLSIFYCAIPVGSALGYILGGIIVRTGLSWRWAFFVVVPPGLTLGCICFLSCLPSKPLQCGSVIRKRIEDQQPLENEVENEATGAPTTDRRLHEEDLPSYDDKVPPQVKPTTTQACSTSGSASAVAGEPLVKLREIRLLCTSPSFLFCSLGMAAQTFALGAYSFWIPKYIVWRNAGTLDQANMIFGLILVITGLTGTLLGGYLGDWLNNGVGCGVCSGSCSGTSAAAAAAISKRGNGADIEIDVVSPGLLPIDFPGESEQATLAAASLKASRSRCLGRIFSGIYSPTLWRIRLYIISVGHPHFLISAVGVGITVPLSFLIMVVPFPVCWVLIFFCCWFTFVNTGPTNAILCNITTPRLRPIAFAVNIFVIHALGDALSPPVVGALTDASATHSMNAGFAAVSLALVASSACFLVGSRFMRSKIAEVGKEQNT